MKKLLLGLTVAFIMGGLLFSQNTVEKTTYHDYWETQKNKVWHELGDGTWHGDVHQYRENGTLQSHAIMDYGELSAKTLYFQSGEVLCQMNNNADAKKHGIQELYTMVKGKRFLKAKAEVDNGFVKDYKSYHKEGVLKLSYSNDGTSGLFKRFDEDGNLALEVSLSDGRVSDFETYGLVFKNNRIESVGINVISAEIEDGRYYISKKFDNKPKSYGYYKIPEQNSYQFDATFHYADNWSFEFDLDLELVENSGGEKSLYLVLNNTNYDETNKWTYSVNSFTNYADDLIRDGEYKSYDQKGQCYIINYVDGEEQWEKNFYPDGTLKIYASTDSTLEYNQEGKVLKETVGETTREFDGLGNMVKKTTGDKFWVYNTEGKVIDSDEIRVKYNELNERYNQTTPTYTQFNNATNEIIAGEFCLDLGTGEFKSICYTKENQYIYEAFKTLHMDYVNTWKAQEEPLNAVLEKYPDGSINWNKDVQLLEKIEIMEATIEYCSVNMETIFEFNGTIEKFQGLLADPEVKNINKSLKKASSPDEIKALVSL